MNEPAAFTIRPRDPGALGIVGLFVVIASMALGYAVTHGWSSWIWFVAWPVGLYYLYLAVVLLVGFVRIDGQGLTVLQLWPREGRYLGLRAGGRPRRRTLDFTAMAKASMLVRSVPRGFTSAMMVTMHDGTTATVNLGLYAKGDCRRLVDEMRRRGVEVFVQPGLLGKGY